MNQYLTSIQNYTHFVPIRTKENLIMFVNPNDQYISRSLMYTGEWEPHIVSVFKQYVKDGMVAIDIGANIGAHTLILSKLVGDSGKVIAFEPCKVNHDILVHNCIINKSKNTDIHKLGCGDKKKSMFIESRWNTTEKEDNYGCVVLQSDQRNKEDEQIHIIPVDDLQLQKVDFMKIDAEEMEDKVLKGCMATIKRCKPIIIVEIHPNDVNKVSQIIFELNYNLTQIGGIDFLAIPKDK
jgi:FkbM family methyltransferase